MRSREKFSTSPISVLVELYIDAALEKPLDCVEMKKRMKLFDFTTIANVDVVVIAQTEHNES